jgi:hypothetical protein
MTVDWPPLFSSSVWPFIVLNVRARARAAVLVLVLVLGGGNVFWHLPYCMAVQLSSAQLGSAQTRQLNSRRISGFKRNGFRTFTERKETLVGLHLCRY